MRLVAGHDRLHPCHAFVGVDDSHAAWFADDYGVWLRYLAGHLYDHVGRPEAPHFFDRYQEFTDSVAIYPGAGNGSVDAMTYVALKMNGEAGEFAEKLGKRIRKGKSITAINRSEMADEFKLELVKELGDVLWYVSQAASELGYSLSDVARINVEKLSSRKERGVLDGKGDNR